jgi:hypothetical protein
MMTKDAIYRVTYPNGEQCHTGYKPLADVWAKRDGAVLTTINLEVPPEQHQMTQRWELLPRLRRLASDFQCHPLSRGISECEEAGQALHDAAVEIERLCRTRNAIVNGTARLRRRVLELERKESPDETVDVADRYAHQLAMWLELILFEYSGKHYSSAIDALGQYRSAMNAIHEKQSPTHMGEPVIERTA